MRVYDKNLIISLLTSDLLKLKCYESQIPTDAVNIQFDALGIMLKLSEEDKKKLTQLTGHSHLYINASGIEGCPFLIENTKGGLLTPQELANIITLAKTGHANTISGLRITLNIGYAAKKYTMPFLNHINKSFADLLQECLINQGMDDIDIVAYTEEISAIRTIPINNKIYKLTGKSSETTNIARQIANQLLGSWPTSHMPSSLTVEVTKTNIAASVEIAILFFQQWNRLIPNQKVLLSQSDSSPVAIDYYQEKNWENTVEQDLNAAGLTFLATTFSQKRTYKDKLCFLRNLGTNQNLALTENADAHHHSQGLKF